MITPRIVLARAIGIADTAYPLDGSESQGCRNTVQQLRGKGLAERRKGRNVAHRQARPRQPGRHYFDGGNGSAHRDNAAAKPAHRAWKENIRAACCVCGGFHASLRRGYPNDAIDRGKRTGQPSGEKIREQAECYVPLRAVAASDPYTRTGQARIATVPPKCTAAARMERAAQQSRAPPLLRGDIVFDRRPGTQWYLQRRPRVRRPPTARSPLLSGAQCAETSGKPGLYPKTPQIKPCSG